MNRAALPTRPRDCRGFTLIEITIATTLAVLLATSAWPSFQSRLSKVRRGDAVLALTRIQLAQEQYRTLHGIYANNLAVLSGAASPLSPEGLYDITLVDAGAESFAALARVHAGRAQERDRDCPWLALRVEQGQVDLAPNPACWNRL